MPQVRISQETLDRINTLCQQYTASVQAGRCKWPMIDQGAKGSWVTVDTLISKALDELEGHRERSKKKKKKPEMEPGLRDYHYDHDPDGA